MLLYILLFSEILIIGGSLTHDDQDETLDSIVYFSPENPESNWTRREQTMITGRWDHVSALLPDGRVLTAGGENDMGDMLSSSELINATTGHVEAGKDMIDRRKGAASAVIADSMYVCGGWNDSATVNSCERFHLEKWTTVTPMKQNRVQLAMVALDGKLFAIGGRYENYNYLSSAERFDPKTNRWEPVSPMSKRRQDHAAAVLNGYIYVCGGDTDTVPDNISFNDCERYDPKKDQWETVKAMNEKRAGFNLVTMNGHLYAIEGVSSRSSIERYDPGKNKWTCLNGTLFKGLFYATAVVL